MDVPPGEVPPVGPAMEDGAREVSPTETAMMQEMLGPPSKKGALKRGFKLLPRILPYLRPYRKSAVISVVLTVLLAALALAEPWPLAFVIDSIIGGEPAPGWAEGIFGSSVGALIALAVVATLFLTLLYGVLTVWNEYLLTNVDQRMVLDFRSEMFEHAQKLSLAFHDNESKGILMYRINDQAAAMGQIVTALPAVAQALLTLIGMAVIAVIINPLLAVLALGTTPFVIYSTMYYTDRIEPRLYRVRGLGAINLAIVYEAMAMMRVVLAFGTQRREYNRFREQGENWVGETVGLTVRQTAFKLVVQMISAAGTASVIGVGAYQAVSGKITSGELLVVLSYVHQIYQPLEQLTTTITSFQQWFINLLLSFELMDMKPEVTEKSDAKSLERARGEVELDGVGFGYATRPGVLKAVSAKIPPGRAVAIVGPTGAGKSTLVSLIPRFYDPKQGVIRIDGHDVRDLQIADVRNQFSIVLQEPLLFSGSIAANIKYAKPDAPMEEVIEAAEAANAHEFISALPDGYETQLGEGGAKVSGGERQRIAVARAFLRDAPILILDEPTSSIDSRTEAVILDALDRLMQGRTTILIAHRLSTLRSVDEVLVMNHGEIVQRGPHAELIEEVGLYRELWEAQTRVSGRRPVVEADLGEGETELRLAPVAKLSASLESVDPEEAADAAVNAAGSSEPEPAWQEGTPAVLPRPKIVLLGMLTKIPVGGVAWLVGHYAAGFKRLGYEVYYVEAHARTPSMFMSHAKDDGAGKAADYIAKTAKRFGFEGRWAFQALHENDRCYGMTPEQLDGLYRDAALIINMHGGTLPLPEHAATDRLVFLGTDPVEVELEVHRGEQRTLEFLDQHVAHFTWGLNYGNPDCALPWARPYSFIPSPPPVVLDFWENGEAPSGPFTTIGNWRQRYRDVRFEDKVYRWSKHQQFMRILDLPMRTQGRFELALSSYEDRDELLLAEHGWRVRPGLELSRDIDSYRGYIVQSAGEVSAAKEQNVHFRTGWFSERSVTYLAAGRPVIVQDTGFGSALPTGEGLFAFADLDQAAEAVLEVQADPARHRRAATELAREFLSHEVVLGDMLDHVGLRRSKTSPKPYNSPAPAQLPPDLPLQAEPGTAETLDDAARERILGRPIPTVAPPSAEPAVSVVMPVAGNLAPTRLAMESLLAGSGEAPHEVVVVDCGNEESMRQYLEALASRNRHVRLVREEGDAGFAASCNRGLSLAQGQLLFVLTNDTVVPPGWLPGLVTHLNDLEVGMVGPTTNRRGGHADVPAAYGTYGEMVEFADRRREEHTGNPAANVEPAEMFCAGIRRDVWEKIGPLAEQLGVGTLEDDYAGRIRDGGLRVVCADEVFVHRLGEASPSSLDDRPPVTMETGAADGERDASAHEGEADGEAGDGEETA